MGTAQGPKTMGWGQGTVSQAKELGPGTSAAGFVAGLGRQSERDGGAGAATKATWLSPWLLGSS